MRDNLEMGCCNIVPRVNAHDELSILESRKNCAPTIILYEQCTKCTPPNVAFWKLLFVLQSIN